MTVTAASVTFPPAPIGLAASAGGIDAIARVLGMLGPDFGAPIVVVEHLTAHHKSHLPAILAPEHGAAREGGRARR